MDLFYKGKTLDYCQSFGQYIFYNTIMIYSFVINVLAIYFLCRFYCLNEIKKKRKQDASRKERKKEKNTFTKAKMHDTSRYLKLRDGAMHASIDFRDL